MRKYFRYLFYFFLCVIDSIINFFCAIFGGYPAVDLANTFLVYAEFGRVKEEMGDREEDKLELHERADQLKQQAYDVLNKYEQEFE